MPLISLNCKRTIVIFVVVIWSGNSFHGPEIFRRNTKNNSCRVTLSLFMDFIISSQFLFSSISSATTLPARGSTTFLKEKDRFCQTLSDLLVLGKTTRNIARSLLLKLKLKCMAQIQKPGDTDYGSLYLRG